MKKCNYHGSVNVYDSTPPQGLLALKNSLRNKHQSSGIKICQYLNTLNGKFRNHKQLCQYAVYHSSVVIYSCILGIP